MRNLLWFDVRKTIISIIGDTHHIEKNECGKKPCEHTHTTGEVPVRLQHLEKAPRRCNGRKSQKKWWQKVTTSSSPHITGTSWEGRTPSHLISQPAAPAQPFPQTEAPYPPQHISYSSGWLEGRRKGKQIIYLCGNGWKLGCWWLAHCNVHGSTNIKLTWNLYDAINQCHLDKSKS